MSYLVKAFEQHDKSEWRFETESQAREKYAEVSGASRFDAAYLYGVGDDGHEHLINSWDDSYGFDVGDDDEDDEDDYYVYRTCSVCGGEFWDGGMSCTCDDWSIESRPVED